MMSKEIEIKFLKERIDELEVFKNRGTTKISFPSIGKSFFIDTALTTLRKSLSLYQQIEK
jgi:hypothetical protein